MKKSPRFHLLTAVLALIALIGILAFLPTEAQAATVTASGSCGATATWSLDSDGVLTVSGTGKMTNYKKTDNPWGDASAIRKIVIEEGITSVGSYAFYNCANAESVSIATSVNRMGTSAFDGCDKLTRVDIADLTAWCRILFAAPSSNPVSEAGGLYLNGQQICDLVVPEGITALQDFAFYGCTSLKTVKLPEGITSIGASAFSGCSALTAINMPASVSTLGASAFLGCSSLATVEIDDLAAWCKVSMSHPNCNPIYAAGSMYINGQKVTDLVIPAGVTVINHYVFAGLKTLKTVTIPDSVYTIGRGCFRDCTGLTAVALPDGVTTIHYEAFNSCTSLKSVKLPAKLTSMDYCVFGDCTSLRTIILPASLKTTGISIFIDCTSLHTVVFLGTPTTLGDNMFHNCPSLRHVLYAGAEADWSAVTLGTGNEALTSATWHYSVTDTTVVDPETGLCKLCQAACAHTFGADDICSKCGLANPNPTKPTDPTEPADPVEKENPFPIFVVVIAAVAVVAVAAVVVIVLKKKK